jgi:hypothetical protein
MLMLLLRRLPAFPNQGRRSSRLNKSPELGAATVGGTAIEASKSAAHCDLEMTGEYTGVSPERQNELTRRIQRRLRDAAGKKGKQKVPQSPVYAPKTGMAYAP